MILKSKQKPRVAIIINNYNYARFLNESIDSALQQTYPNTEVIVVDDGSSDGTQTILKAYEKDVKVIVKENGGQASAFNAGFQACNSDLINFLDSDDVLMPQAMEAAVAAWNQKLSKLQFPLALIDSDSSPKPGIVPRGKLSRGNVSCDILSAGSYCTPPTSGNVYSRSFLDQVMPIPCTQWRKGADTYLNTHAGFHGEVGAVDQPLGKYRIHGDNMSGIVQAGTIQVAQITYLLDLHKKMKLLVEEIAESRNLKVRKNLLMHNGTYLKLLLTLEKIAGQPSLRHCMQLSKAVVAMVRCMEGARGVSLFSKLLMVGWASAMALLPRRLAFGCAAAAFDVNPRSKILAALRRI